MEARLLERLLILRTQNKKEEYPLHQTTYVGTIRRLKCFFFVLEFARIWQFLYNNNFKGDINEFFITIIVD